jgi:hypothetical protein
LTAFLNSKLFKFTFKDYFPELLGDAREIRKVFFETITIKPYVNTEIFDLKVVAIERQKAEHLSTLNDEQEINKLIFEHYDLTASEISIIEDSASVSVFSEKSTSLISESVSV